MACDNPEKTATDSDLMKHYGLEEGTYFIVDIGANLSDRKFSRDLDSVIQRSKDSGEKTYSWQPALSTRILL